MFALGSRRALRLYNNILARWALGKKKKKKKSHPDAWEEEDEGFLLLLFINIIPDAFFFFKEMCLERHLWLFAGGGSHIRSYGADAVFKC